MSHGPAPAAARLQDLRLTVLERLAGLRALHAGVVAASYDSNADDEHDPEGHTIAFERSQVDAVVRQATQHLAEVDEALVRVRTGTYGVCETCARAIPEERLVARPTARHCVSCQGRP